MVIVLISTEAMAGGRDLWNYQAYLDLGYGYSFNTPENNLWRSKSTTFIFSSPRINMVMGYVGKEVREDSPWGMEFGLQAGVDTDGLVPSAPPEANTPKDNADLFRYLYRANAIYRIPVGNGLKVSAGLINSYIAFESYLSLDNPTYTKGYLTDNVPYFFTGAQFDYPLNDRTRLSLFIVDGWNYLAKSNHQPSYGFQVAWKSHSNLTLIQNLYYGPEQLDTSLQYWRFFFDSIVSWENDNLLLAISIDGGTEKQVETIHHPRYYWMSGAIWGAVTRGSWQFSFRPEFYHDKYGLMSGAKQNIWAVSAAIGYILLSETSDHNLKTKLEYRFDHSSGPEGGYYKGDDNHLAPDQNMLLLSLVWRFRSL